MATHAGAKPTALLTAPVVPLVARLAAPNALALGASTATSVAETAYVGMLGVEPLAGLALVYPMVMLMQTMSAGAMGGGVSSAIARALGANDEAKARALAQHALVIALLGGAFFTVFFLAWGEVVYRALGGAGAPLAQALIYSRIVFAGAIAVWLVNTLASLLRGTGEMRVPSATLLAIAALQVTLGGALALGIGPLPRWGMAGVAFAYIIAHAAGALFLAWFMLAGRARVPLGFARFTPNRDMFRDILKVGGVALISPLQTIATVLVITRIMAFFGDTALAGYGVGARLEFLLIPLTFAVGAACIPLVGMAIGAGNVARAKQVAWTGGCLGALLTGVAGLTVAVAPTLWSSLFSRDPAVLAAANEYLRIAGPAFALFGFGHGLYFSSQGSGKILGPVLAGTLRLTIVAVGGWQLAINAMPAWTMFTLVALAMVAYGAACAVSVNTTRWGK